MATASSFRDLLLSLDLSQVESVLDVGAGGFTGETTTVHLLELGGRRVTALEIDADRARNLEERFGGELEVVCDDIQSWRPEGRFDLVVLDLDSHLIPLVFERLLQNEVLELLRPGGLVVTLVLADAEQAFHGPKALDPSGEEALTSFMDRHFGTRTLDEEDVRSFYAADPHYRVVALVEKWPGDRANYIDWLALRRLS